MNTLIENVKKWSSEKGIDQADPAKQFLKVSEEVGEIAAALARDDKEELIDAIGDTMVTLIILAQQNKLEVQDCLKHAYNIISKRTGEMKNGVFVKQEDL